MVRGAYSVPVRVRGRTALVVGLLAVSTSAPFFVMSRLDAVAAVFWRTALAGALGLVLSFRRGEVTRRQWAAHRGQLCLGGVVLGAHFLLWVKAFELTDYASTLLLLVAQPMAGALIARLQGQPLSKSALVAIGLSCLGLFSIAGGDFSLGPRALLGDAFAVTAAVLQALFYVCTQRARRELPLASFMGACLTVASCVALPVALVRGVTLWGFALESWWWLVGMVVITTWLGHGSLNLAARTESLFTMTLVIVLEPPLSMLLGAFMFDVNLTATQLLGGALLSLAVVIGTAHATASVEATPGEAGFARRLLAPLLGRHKPGPRR